MTGSAVNCVCVALGPRGSATASTTSVGLDETAGRFGNVDLDRCMACARLWLHYQVAYEDFTGSGRWATCEIPEPDAAAMISERAIAYIDARPRVVGGLLLEPCREARHGPATLVSESS